jgi:hypothetical protein
MNTFPVILVVGSARRWAVTHLGCARGDAGHLFWMRLVCRRSHSLCTKTNLGQISPVSWGTPKNQYSSREPFRNRMQAQDFNETVPEIDR